jgi:multicomponent Na+:H+ antiporter subunit F
MDVVFTVVTVMLAAAAAVTVVRLLRGPATLDRVVAMDMLLAITMCGLATFAAATLDSTAIPVLVVVSLLGFTGAVSIARILGRSAR